MKPFLLASLLLVLLGAGCRSSEKQEKLGDAKWVLETLNSRAVKLSDPGTAMFMIFDDAEKRVNGRAACNRFFGNYELEGRKLRFSPMGATRMACPDLAWETEFFSALDNVDSFSIKDDVLTLSGKGRALASFRRSSAGE